jgi:hypothetical protein
MSSLLTKARGRAQQGIRSLIDLPPMTGHVVRGGVEINLPIDDGQLGEAMIVRPGERIPTDGAADRSSGFPRRRTSLSPNFHDSSFSLRKRAGMASTRVSAVGSSTEMKTSASRGRLFNSIASISRSLTHGLQSADHIFSKNGLPRWTSLICPRVPGTKPRGTDHASAESSPSNSGKILYINKERSIEVNQGIQSQKMAI